MIGDEPSYEDFLKGKGRIEALEEVIEELEGYQTGVCRRICVALYDEIIKLRQEWCSDEDESGILKIVMTGAASDPKEWQQHIGGKTHLASRRVSAH